MVDFAIWDLNSTIKNSQPASLKCSRFGGEGEGAHCETAMKLKIGATYELRIFEVSANATGVVWGATLNGTDMGQLYWNEQQAGKTLGRISKKSFVTFQEYFTLQVQHMAVANSSHSLFQRTALLNL
jgi:hypothetical protein